MTPLDDISASASNWGCSFCAALYGGSTWTTFTVTRKLQTTVNSYQHRAVGITTNMSKDLFMGSSSYHAHGSDTIELFHTVTMGIFLLSRSRRVRHDIVKAKNTCLRTWFCMTECRSVHPSVTVQAFRSCVQTTEKWMHVKLVLSTNALSFFLHNIVIICSFI